MDLMDKNMFGQASRQNLISTGNETFDKFLGGGFLNSTLNLFERTGPSSKLLDAVWNKSFAATTLASKNNLLVVDFNTTSDVINTDFISSLPVPRKVKSELMYKDIRGKSSTAKIKIAWRYSNRSLSPSDSLIKMNQLDFGLSLAKETESQERGDLKFMRINENFTLQDLLLQLESNVAHLKMDNKTVVNVIVRNLLHPFSPISSYDDDQQQKILINLMFSLRCFSRTLEKGAILVSYDCSLCTNHSQIKQYLYNISDCVVSFHSYETGQNKISGYKNADGTLEYVKVPKINSFGLHFQQDLSDWGYRLTKNNRFFVIDELSLPPYDDDDADKDRAKTQSAVEITKIGQQDIRRLEQVGPLEEFKEVAEDVIAKRL